ncbi:hypothetical protein ACLESO_06425 [Pyxidicoccus sp. 3LG]
MESNYGSPLPSGGSTAQAKEAVTLPAILLMVMSALTFLYGVVSLVQPVDQAQLQPLMDNPQFEQFRGVFEFLVSGSGRLIVSLPFLILNALVFFGALKMKGLQSYGLAMTAAIISVIPCCGPCYCLAIPVGIWALVVLRKPEVRAAFT